MFDLTGWVLWALFGLGVLTPQDEGTRVLATEEAAAHAGGSAGGESGHSSASDGGQSGQAGQSGQDDQGSNTTPRWLGLTGADIYNGF